MGPMHPYRPPPGQRGPRDHKWHNSGSALCLLHMSAMIRTGLGNTGSVQHVKAGAAGTSSAICEVFAQVLPIESLGKRALDAFRIKTHVF